MWRAAADSSVINQTDTSGGHINGTSTPKEKNGDFSKEELAAILKFGAKSMFQGDENAQNEKLDAMDLDDILTKADNFDTEAAAAPAGTSSGGEAFLAQFAAIQDVKNDADDLSWDDIIPVDERVKMDEEESRALQAEEMGSRKRAAARAPGAYEGMDEAEPEPRDSKAPSPSERKAKVTGPRKSNAQRAIELKGESICPFLLSNKQTAIFVSSFVVFRNGVPFGRGTTPSSRRRSSQPRTELSSSRRVTTFSTKLKRPSRLTRTNCDPCKSAAKLSRRR